MTTSYIVSRQDAGLSKIGLRYRVYVRPTAEYRRIKPDTPKVQWVMVAAFVDMEYAEEFAFLMQKAGWTIRLNSAILPPLDQNNEPIKGEPFGRGRKSMPLPCGCSRGVRIEDGKQRKDVKYVGDGTLICKHGRYTREGKPVPLETKKDA